MQRDDDEREVADEQLAVVPYFSSGSGFLTRPTEQRTEGSAIFSHAGLWAFDALETIALARRVRPAVVALAWLRTRPGVVAPIVKARAPGQLADLIASTSFDLDTDEHAALDEIAETALDW